MYLHCVYLINSKYNENNKILTHFYVKMSEIKKSPLKDYYDSLTVEDSRVLLRNKLAEECGVTIMTVYRWINGEVIPDKLKREKISEIVGIPIDELFPEIEMAKG